MPILLGNFELERLGRDASTLVAIDKDYVIQWVNAGWERFALENRGLAIPKRFGVGASYLSGISGPLRDFYRSAFDNALLTGEPFELDYECSSPEVFRRCHMTVQPIGSDGLLVTHSGIIDRSREIGEQHEPSEEDYRLPSGILVQCANCRRVRRKDGSSWDWVPAWVEALPDRTSHGVCAPCRGVYWDVFKKRW